MSFRRKLLSIVVLGAIPAALLMTTAPPTSAVVPGRNGKIAFTSYRDGNKEIYVMNADGSHQVNLTKNGADDVDPAWSPDGTKIAFASDRHVHGQFQIHVMSASGTGVKRLTNVNAGIGDTTPTWSPDGSRIAFRGPSDVEFGHQLYDIFIMNADGSALARLTLIASGTDYEPDWSPAGTTIALSSSHAATQVNKGKEIFLVSVVGSSYSRITNEPSNETQPAWSPNGKSLAFTSDISGHGNLYRVSSAGNEPWTRLTNHSSFDEMGAWSPDGKQIVFTSDRSGGDREIWTLDVATKAARRLTKSPGADYDPSWQRAPATSRATQGTSQRGGGSTTTQSKGSWPTSTATASTSSSPTPAPSQDLASARTSGSGGGFPSWLLFASIAGALVIGFAGFIAGRKRRPQSED
jgi:Tol biopolymer transport system component